MVKCKVCNRTYKEINISHVRSIHDLSWTEYEAIGVIALVVEGEPVVSVWDSVNIDSIEFRMRYRKMRYNIVHIRDRECVDLRQGKNCYGCLQVIDELAVYIILSGDKETRYKRPEFMKKPYHRDCAVAKADSFSLLGVVMNPIDTTKLTKSTKETNTS